METQDYVKRYLTTKKVVEDAESYLNKKIEKYNRLIEKTKKQLQKLYKTEYRWVAFVNDIMQNVADELNLNFDGCNTTFGLRCECPLFLKDKETNEVVYGIVFLPPTDEDELEYDNNKKRVDVRANTIASLNGFGNSTSKIKIAEVTTEKMIEILKEIMKNSLENSK